MRSASATQVAATSTRTARVLTWVGLSLLLVLALVAVDIVVIGLNAPLQAVSPHYYMALGNSLSFGYQPNLDFSSGFADDILYDLRQAEVKQANGVVINPVNYACAGETTQTMIDGGCAGRFAHHGSYTGPQLQAALDFLTNPRYAGHVSPITLEVGANDVFQDWNSSTCSISSTANADLATMDANLTNTILPELTKALTTPRGAPTGDLHLLNYYNPFAQVCPNSGQFVRLLNDHLQADAAKFKVPVVDVYKAFGGDTDTVKNLCAYTWMCDPRFHDIHPTNKGYQVIANAVEATLGLPGGNPMGVAPAAFAAPALGAGAAALWRRVAMIANAHND
ncbi:MAG TPA: SGNH/GDSL hydrolase family protein [Ktedonobacterales bacterium]